MTSSTVKMPANVYSSAFITLLITVPSSGSTCELKILWGKKKHAPAPASPFSFHFLLPGAPAHETFLRKTQKKNMLQRLHHLLHSCPFFRLHLSFEEAYENTFSLRTHSLWEHILYETTFYLRTHSMWEHILSQAPGHWRGIWEHILYENTFYMRPHSLWEHILSENTFYVKSPGHWRGSTCRTT